MDALDLGREIEPEQEQRQKGATVLGRAAEEAGDGAQREHRRGQHTCAKWRANHPMRQHRRRVQKAQQPGNAELPAVFCPALVDLVRSRSPDVVIMTDDIVAGSLLPPGLTGQARLNAIAANAVTAFQAGVDLILTLDAAASSTIVKTLTAAVAANPSLQARLVESYNRVLSWRSKLA